MKLTRWFRILNNPIALSRPVLLLQIPLALALGFGTRSTALRQNPFLVLLFATLFIIGAGICFALGNWSLARFSALERNRSLVTLITWLVTGFLCVGISEISHVVALHLLHPQVIGSPLPQTTRLLFIPPMWLASLLATSHVFQSRTDYLVKFRQLAQTNFLLSEAEELSEKEIDNERQKLIAIVSETIKPELRLIATEIRGLETPSSPNAQIAKMLDQIDNYSLKTLRQLIKDLDEVVVLEYTHLKHIPVMENPKLKLRELPLDPLRSLRIAAFVGGSLLLPVVGVRVDVLWLIQVLLIFMPVFGIYALRTGLKFLKAPEILWTLLGFVSVIIMRLFGVSALSQVQTATSHQYLPYISGTLFGFSVLIGSIDRYFIDSYQKIFSQQELANSQLIEKLDWINNEQQLVRKNFARLLHGPIQSRLAAVRMRLHILADASSIGLTEFDQVSINQIADMVEQITHEIETLAEPVATSDSTSVADELDALKINWKGLMEITIDLTAEVIAVLDQNSNLSHKVKSACTEAITNACRNGKANELTISLELADDGQTVVFVVQDNGIGVNGPVQPGFGLKDIAADGGNWSFEPCEKGARFKVEFVRPIYPILQKS